MEKGKKVLLNWLSVSSYSIEALEKCISICRSIIRINTITSLAFSTISGSLSVTSYTKNNAGLSLVLNVLLTVCSFSVAVLGSIIKVYQYQERLEVYIKIKQEWVSFASVISTEIDLPKDFRRSDNEIIKVYKDKYNTLLSHDYELFARIKKDFKKNISNIDHDIIPKKEGLRIHDILLNNVKRQFTLEEVVIEPVTEHVTEILTHPI